MKEFGDWVADMANSVEDASIIKRTKANDKLTPMQLRMHFADMLIPSLNTLENCEDWMNTFCIITSGKDGNKSFIFSFCTVLGDDKVNEFIELPYKYNYLKDFIDRFRKSIENGWEP